MDLKIYKSLWGMTGPLEVQLERIKAAGYDGVEAAPQDITDTSHFRSQLNALDLSFIALVYTEGTDHIEHLKRVVGDAAALAPTTIVAHGGRDLMSYVRQIRFFVAALRLEDDIGITIAHETHRRRPFFTPMNTSAILRELPEIKLNLDFSHWCCVTESLLEDHADALALAIEHSAHLHGRVGYENGPQVPDPRVPEWERCVIKHEAWWDAAIKSQRDRGYQDFTFTPEYGPPTYMQTVPDTGSPTADLWDVCLWTKQRFESQFKRATLGGLQPPTHA